MMFTALDSEGWGLDSVLNDVAKVKKAENDHMIVFAFDKIDLKKLIWSR